MLATLMRRSRLPRSLSMERDTPGNCTFTATSRPHRVTALCTWPATPAGDESSSAHHAQVFKFVLKFVSRVACLAGRRDSRRRVSERVLAAMRNRRRASAVRMRIQRA
eukprot:1192612-Prorocentrum_minimum.AAC.3